MHNYVAFIVTILLFWLTSAESAPIEAYAQLPLYENVALSPDGQQIAFATTLGEEREIIIQPLAALADSDGVSRIKAGKQNLYHLDWLGNEQLFIIYSESIEYIYGRFIAKGVVANYDLKRSTLFNVLNWPDSRIHPTGQLWPRGKVIDGKPMVFISGHAASGLQRYRYIPALAMADLTNQTTSLIESVPSVKTEMYYDWETDERGKPVVRTTYNDINSTWSLEVKKQEKWHQIYFEKDQIPYLIGLNQSGDTVVIKVLKNEASAFMRFSLQDASLGRILPEDGVAISRYLRDMGTNRLIGYSWHDVRSHLELSDAQLNKNWEQIAASFPDEELQLLTWSAGMHKMIISTFGRTTGATYILVDINSKQFTRLGNMYGGISAADVAEVKPISYEAADGLKISGYLTLPHNRPAKDLPLIVLPHAGPSYRNYFAFDWLAQALASKGYSILQANFRGSGGSGTSLELAGAGEQGRKMQTDLSDGVRALANLGIIDPARVCIVGVGRYGGYAALNGVTLEPSVYRCAASFAGVTDLKQFWEDGVTNHNVESSNRKLKSLLHLIGATNINSAAISQRSPVYNANKITAKILLIHSKKDQIVPIAQSQIMANALDKAKKPYEFVKLKSEDHWLSKSETRLQTLQAVVKFLDIHNPP